jgi:hypothetical protein
MKLNTKHILNSLAALIILINFSSSIAHADSLEIGNIVYGGNGCPKGSAEVYLNDDQSEMFIRFKNYSAEAGGKLSSLARKSCNFAIPLHIPQGISVSLLSFDYLGHLSLPKKATAQFSAEYFFAGVTGVKASKTFTGRTEGDFLIQNQVVLEETSWSKCGEDTILRLNSSLLVKSNRRNESSVASIDGEALETGILYKIQSKHCD